VTYGLGAIITREAMEDNQYESVATRKAAKLARSMRQTKENVHANVLNRAFTAAYAGGDGKELCATDHPTAASGDFSNELSTPAALSHTSLEQMLIQIRNATDHRGKKITLRPKKLVIPTSLMFTAEVLLKSTLRSGTANNDINAVKSMSMLSDKPAVISRLTSTTAWWIHTDAPEGLKILMRRKMTRSSEGDFETDSMKYKATERYGTGWTDPRGIYGTAGV
jgi:phage major head subunit gpT-like protein